MTTDTVDVDPIPPPTALAIVPPPVGLSVQRDPDQVMAEAVRCAKVAKSVFDNKPKKVIMNGKPYPEYEDWSTMARFYSVTSRIRSVQYVEYGETRGFNAVAEAVHMQTGEVLSVAEADCLNDEPKWRSRAKYTDTIKLKDGRWVDQAEADRLGTSAWVWTRSGGRNRPEKKRQYAGDEPVPLFQLKSMAQTRAGAKVLRQLFSWVMVLAGYQPTPAEEIDGMIPDEAPPPPAEDDDPRVLQNELEQPQGTSAPSKVSAPPPAAAPADPHTLFVTKIEKKPTRNPSTTRYTIWLSDGDKVATIKDVFWAVAQEAWDGHLPVVVRCHPTEYGLELDAIKLRDRQPGEDEENPVAF